MDQELRNLKKNTVVIAIANIGSKGISWEYPKVCVNLQTDVR